MKNNNIICWLIITLVFISAPLSADRKGAKPDPLDESMIVNNLEMDVDSVSGQENGEDVTGDIIFDDSFSETESKSVKETRPDRKNSRIINTLRSRDKRWHLVEYVIKSNDTIWGIAKKYDISSDVIIELNDIQNPGQIRKGQVLLIPSKQGVYYTIKKGDTLTSISRKYRSEISEIATINNIDGSDIKAGKKIFLPGAVEYKETVVKKRVKPEIDDTRLADSRERKNNKKTANRSSGIVLTWPLRGPVTSGFGYRKDPFSGSKRFHCGMDIGAEIGTPVKAAGNGKVIFSGWKGSYGYLVVIAHEKNYITVYAHNSKNLVKTGEIIKKGEVVALSGNTGAVTGAHLHFEIRKGTVPLNPRRLLKK